MLYAICAYLDFFRTCIDSSQQIGLPLPSPYSLFSVDDCLTIAALESGCTTLKFLNAELPTKQHKKPKALQDQELKVADFN